MQPSPRSTRTSAVRLRRTVALVAGAALILGLIGTGVANADNSAALDEILNSADGKKDRTGAPSGNNLVALKIDAATDVAKRQRILDRLARELASAPADCGANADLTIKVADSSVVLNEVAGRIAAATDMKVAKTAASELFPSTRVISLVLPQVSASLVCADSVTQIQVLQGRVTAGVAALESLKSTSEGQAALAQAGVASAALKAVPPLGQAATSVAGLVPDKGDPNVFTANAAAVSAARTQVRATEVAVQVAERSVREFERMAEAAKRKTNRTTTKVKKTVK